MKWFKRLLLRWMRHAMDDERERNGKAAPPIETLAVGSPGGTLNGDHVYSVTLRKAVNGVILELGAYKPNPRGPDWTYTHFLVPEGENISEAVTALLVNQRLQA